jgi:hypothetical protein
MILSKPELIPRYVMGGCPLDGRLRLEITTITTLMHFLAEMPLMRHGLTGDYEVDAHIVGWRLSPLYSLD